MALCNGSGETRLVRAIGRYRRRRDWCERPEPRIGSRAALNEVINRHLFILFWSERYEARKWILRALLSGCPVLDCSAACTRLSLTQNQNQTLRRAPIKPLPNRRVNSMTAVQAIGRAAIMDPVIGVLEPRTRGSKPWRSWTGRSWPPAGDLGNVVPAVPIADLALAEEATRAGRAAGLPEWAAMAREEDPEWILDLVR